MKRSRIHLYATFLIPLPQCWTQLLRDKQLQGFTRLSRVRANDMAVKIETIHEAADETKLFRDGRGYRTNPFDMLLQL
jgi:hypothetical protein